MPDLLLELYSEEIPARMQAAAQENLKKLVTDALVDAGLKYEGAKAFSTPRRLALAVQGLPARQPDLREEKKGPRVGAPEKAIEGFLRSAGLKSIDQAKVQKDAKGDFYVAVIERKGRPGAEVIADIVPEVVRNFPWPKSMRWGDSQADSVVTESGDAIVTESGDSVVVPIRWVRPLHSIVCTFGPETEEPEIVNFDIGGIQASNVTFGHRVHAPGRIEVRRLADWLKKLEAAKVVPDRERRKQTILAEAKNLAFAQGLELVEDEGLLEEVAGLAEWPVVLMSEFEAAFLDLPPEVIRATIRQNQKCFVLRHPSTPLPGGERSTPSASETSGEGGMTSGRTPSPASRPIGRSATSPQWEVKNGLANKFILVADVEAKDGGKAIKAGNARVIRARLADAKFFWEQDRKKKLEERLPKLKGIVFHEKLGTQAERVERIAALAKELAPLVKADPKKAERAARLAKADLVTEMVGEFPELQGLMGKYYALAQGEDAAVARAIEEHYKPQGPSDRVPTASVSVAVALADKIDTLVGFWAIDEKPTGSKDPYALRRAALGIIRLVLENNLKIKLSKIYSGALLNIVSGANVSIEQEVVRKLSGKDIAYYEWYEIAKEKLFSPVLNYDALMDKYFDLIYKNDPIKTDHADIKPIIPILLKRADDLDGYLAAMNIATGKMPDAGDQVATSLGAALPALQRILQPALNEFSKRRLEFDADRLKVHLRDQGARYDLVDAVFALEGQDDLLLIVRRVEALGKFLDSDDGKNLLVGYKRAANILRDEEKKDKKTYSGEPDAKLYQAPEEKALAQAIGAAEKEVAAALKKEDFEAAMTAMARLRAPVDSFFDKVTVNVEDKKLRENRLRLLDRIRAATRTVADFSRIEG